MLKKYVQLVEYLVQEYMQKIFVFKILNLFHFKKHISIDYGTDHHLKNVQFIKLCQEPRMNLIFL